jgi:hypothetical protein
MVTASAIAFLVAGTSTSTAHAPLLSCFENENATITCEAGYSDGSSAAGQIIRVREQSGRLILESVFDPSSVFVFSKPSAPFVVDFIGDPSHVATFDGDELANQ